jgi:hypothetical protein
MPMPLGSAFNRLEISQNSAGLGIPRGGVKNLNQLSSTAQQQGFATAKVHTAPVGVSWWNRGYSEPASHAGVAHASVASASSAHGSAGHSSGHH